MSGDMPLTQGTADAAAVADFLRAHAAELQLGIDPKALTLVHEANTPVGKFYRYQKTVDGVPVHNAFVIMQVDHQASVRHIEVSHNAHLLPAADAVGGQDIGAQGAQTRALDSLGNIKLRASKPEPVKMYFPTDTGLRLAYQVLVLTREPMHDWRIFVDADSGAILEKEDILKSTPDGSGMVFDPNPVVTANNNTL